MPSNFNYELLIKTLVGNNIPLNVQVIDGKIQLSANSKENIEQILQKLQYCFNSSAQLQEVLKYRFSAANVVAQSVTSSTQVSQQQSRAIPPATPKNAQDLLTSLIGEEVLENNAIAIASIFGKKSTVKDGVIFSREVTDANIIEAWRNNIEFLLRFFDNVTIEQIREAIDVEDKYLPEPLVITADVKNKSFARGLLQECFGLQQFENPLRVVAYFNLTRFYQFIYPPQMIYTQTDETTYTCTLDEEHFIAHLKALMQSSVLLKIFKNSANQNFALPIPLGLLPSAKKQQSYCLVIDTSLSMEEFNAHNILKEQVATFLTKLKQKCIDRGELPSDTFVKLIFFDGKVYEKQETTLNNVEGLISDVNRQALGNGTSLCGAINAAFNDARNRKLTDNRTHTIIFFTDGGENTLNQSGKNGMADIKSVKFYLQDVFDQYARSGLKLPHLFTFGYSNPSREILQSIANHTHSPYLELPDLNDFERILNDYSPEMRTQREIVDILTSISGTGSFSVPVYGNIGPQMPRVVIPLSGSQPLYLMQDNRKLSITFDPNNIPHQDLQTHLASISAQVTSIIIDPKITNKPNALKPMYDQLERLRPEASTASVATQEFFNELHQKLGGFLKNTYSIQTELLRPTVSTQSQSSNNNSDNNNINSSSNATRGYVVI
jgi:hypothetical protein